MQEVCDLDRIDYRWLRHQENSRFSCQEVLVYSYKTFCKALCSQTEVCEVYSVTDTACSLFTRGAPSNQAVQNPMVALGKLFFAIHQLKSD